MANYACKHHRDGIEMVTRDDPAIPPHVEILICPECEAWIEWDTITDEPV